jgi:hypothetical protein
MPTLSVQEIELSILTLRGQRVMLSADLATLYGVVPKVLMQAVRRNIERFPVDFMFQLNDAEWSGLKSQGAAANAPAQTMPNNLKSQIVTSSWGGQRHPPYAFTEQGIAMLSSVLRSPQAVQVNIEIMRTFVRLRCILSEHQELARRIDELEGRYDQQFCSVFEAIRQIMTPPAGKTNPIGFTVTISAEKDKT